MPLYFFNNLIVHSGFVASPNPIALTKLTLHLCVCLQIAHKNRQKKLAKIVADLSREPEPYLEPHHNQHQKLQDELPILEAAAVSKVAMFDGDRGMVGNGMITMPGSIYADLGGVEPVNLISFAYQIASGLVNMTCTNIANT